MTQLAREGGIRSCLSQIPSVFDCRDVTSRSRAGDTGDMWSPFLSTFWLIEQNRGDRGKQASEAGCRHLDAELHCQTHPFISLLDLLGQLIERTPCSHSESPTSLVSSARALH